MCWPLFSVMLACVAGVSESTVIKDGSESTNFYFSEKRYTVQKTWRFCQVKGGQLAILDTKEKFQYVTSLLQDYSDQYDRFYVNALQKSGTTYKWANGVKVRGSFWGEGQPEVNRSYVQLKFNRGSFLLASSFGTYLRHALCETILSISNAVSSSIESSHDLLSTVAAFTTTAKSETSEMSTPPHTDISPTPPMLFVTSATENGQEETTHSVGPGSWTGAEQGTDGNGFVRSEVFTALSSSLDMSNIKPSAGVQTINGQSLTLTGIQPTRVSDTSYQRILTQNSVTTEETHSDSKHFEDDLSLESIRSTNYVSLMSLSLISVSEGFSSRSQKTSSSPVLVMSLDTPTSMQIRASSFSLNTRSDKSLYSSTQSAGFLIPASTSSPSSIIVPGTSFLSKPLSLRDTSEATQSALTSKYESTQLESDLPYSSSPDSQSSLMETHVSYLSTVASDPSLSQTSVSELSVSIHTSKPASPLTSASMQPSPPAPPSTSYTPTLTPDTFLSPTPTSDYIMSALSDLICSPTPASDVFISPTSGLRLLPAPASDVLLSSTPAPDIFVSQTHVSDLHISQPPATDLLLSSKPASDLLLLPTPTSDIYLLTPVSFLFLLPTPASETSLISSSGSEQFFSRTVESAPQLPTKSNPDLLTPSTQTTPTQNSVISSAVELEFTTASRFASEMLFSPTPESLWMSVQSDGSQTSLSSTSLLSSVPVYFASVAMTASQLPFSLSNFFMSEESSSLISSPSSTTTTFPLSAESERGSDLSSFSTTPLFSVVMTPRSPLPVSSEASSSTTLVSDIILQSVPPFSSRSTSSLAFTSNLSQTQNGLLLSTDTMLSLTSSVTVPTSPRSVSSTVDVSSTSTSSLALQPMSPSQRVSTPSFMFLMSSSVSQAIFPPQSISSTSVSSTSTTTMQSTLSWQSDSLSAFSVPSSSPSTLVPTSTFPGIRDTPSLGPTKRPACCTCRVEFKDSAGSPGVTSVDRQVVRTKAELTLDITALSKHHRKLSSATDSRPSSQAMGLLAIILLTTMFVGMLCSDLLCSPRHIRRKSR